MKSNFSKFIHCNQFQFSVEGNDARTQKSKALKVCFNTFKPVDKDFSLAHSLIYLTFFYSLKSRNIGQKILRYFSINALMAHLKNDLCFKTIQILVPLKNGSVR